MSRKEPSARGGSTTKAAARRPPEVPPEPPAGTVSARKASAGPVTVYSFEGVLEMGTLARAKELLQDSTWGKAPKILFDLSGVRFIDSAGLGFLIGSLRRATEAGGDLRLCGLSAYLLGIFRLVNLQNVLKVYETQEAALAAFRR